MLPWAPPYDQSNIIHFDYHAQLETAEVDSTADNDRLLLWLCERNMHFIASSNEVEPQFHNKVPILLKVLGLKRYKYAVDSSGTAVLVASSLGTA